MDSSSREEKLARRVKVAILYYFGALIGAACGAGIGWLAVAAVLGAVLIEAIIFAVQAWRLGGRE